MSELLEAALATAERGLAVLPLEPGDKAPLGALAHNGAYSATLDPDLIRRWWTRGPQANLGVALREGLFAVDVDPRAGGHLALAELEAENGDLPATLWQRTGGSIACPVICAEARGAHYLFQMNDTHEGGVPGGKLRNPLTGAAVDGIDLKGEGGFIVWAPSRHPSGGRYELAVPLETEIAEVPVWMVPMLPCGATQGEQVVMPETGEEVWFDLDTGTIERLLLYTWERYGPNRREFLAMLAYRLYHALTPPKQAHSIMLWAAAAAERLSTHREPFDVGSWVDRKLAQVYARRGRRPNPSPWRLRQLLRLEEREGVAID